VRDGPLLSPHVVADLQVGVCKIPGAAPLRLSRVRVFLLPTLLFIFRASEFQFTLSSPEGFTLTKEGLRHSRSPAVIPLALSAAERTGARVLCPMYRSPELPTFSSVRAARTSGAERRDQGDDIEHDSFFTHRLA